MEPVIKERELNLPSYLEKEKNIFIKTGNFLNTQ